MNEFGGLTKRLALAIISVIIIAVGLAVFFMDDSPIRDAIIAWVASIGSNIRVA